MDEANEGTRQMAIGTIRMFDPDSGRGIIAPDDGSAEVSVYARSFKKNGLGAPNDGDRVVYDVKADRRGEPEAVNLKFFVAG